MKGPPFVDTSILVAAFSRRDAAHPTSLDILRRAEQPGSRPLVVTDFVLAETINYINRKVNAHTALHALRKVEASPAFRLERTPDSTWLRAKAETFEKYEKLSLVDAVTVTHMMHFDSSTIYSLDSGLDSVEAITRLTAPA